MIPGQVIGAAYLAFLRGLALGGGSLGLAGGGSNFGMLFAIAAAYLVIGGILMLIVPDQAKAPTADGKAAKES